MRLPLNADLKLFKFDDTLIEYVSLQWHSGINQHSIWTYRNNTDIKRILDRATFLRSGPLIRPLYFNSHARQFADRKREGSGLGGTVLSERHASQRRGACPPARSRLAPEFFANSSIWDHLPGLLRSEHPQISRDSGQYGDPELPARRSKMRDAIDLQQTPSCGDR